MADNNVIEAVLRERGGKGAARRTRREGLVPGVIYGGKQEPITIAIDFPTLQRTLKQNPQFLSTIYTIKVDGQEHMVLPRDMQLDALTDFPIHIDFLRLTGDSRDQRDRAGGVRERRCLAGCQAWRCPQRRAPRG